MTIDKKIFLELSTLPVFSEATEKNSTVMHSNTYFLIRIPRYLIDYSKIKKVNLRFYEHVAKRLDLMFNNLFYRDDYLEIFLGKREL